MVNSLFSFALSLLLLGSPTPPISLLASPATLPTQLPNGSNVMRRSPTPDEQRSPTSEEDAIEQLVLEQIRVPKLPQLRAAVTNIAIVQDYAMAGWALGEGGGSMALHRQAGNWQILRGGGGSMGSTDLVRLGVPDRIAVPLVRQYQSHWPRLQEEQR